MVDVATLSVKVDTTQVAKGTRDLDRLGDQAAVTGQQVERGTKRASSGFNTMSRSVGRLTGGQGLRQVSLQLSQVAQQAQVTGRPLQALAVQLPDIGLAFGTIGIAAGVAAGALLPLIGNLIGAREELEDIEALSLDQTRNALGGLVELQGQYIQAQQLAAQTSSETADIAVANIKREFDARVQLLRLEEVQLEQRRRQLEQSLEAQQAALRELLVANREMLDLQVQQEAAGQARTASEDARLESTRAILDANQDLVLSIREDQAQLELVNLALDEMNFAFSEGVSVANELSGSIAGAAANAAVLASNAQAAMAAAREFTAAQGFSSRFAGEEAVMAQEVVPVGRGDPLPRRSRGGGGGGGRRRDPREAEAARIFERTRTEAEKYKRELEDLNELHQMGYLDADTYARAVEQVGESYEKTATDMDDFANLGRQAFTDLVTGAESLSQVLDNLLGDLARLLANKAFSVLFGGALGGGGFLGGLLSFDGGGYTGSGSRTGGVDGRGGFPAILHPNETVIDHSKGGGGTTDVRVFVDQNGNWQAAVDRIAGRKVQQARPGIVSDSVKGVYAANQRQPLR